MDLYCRENFNSIDIEFIKDDLDDYKENDPPKNINTNNENNTDIYANYENCKKQPLKINTTNNIIRNN
ncbi:hypothetical protein MYSEV_247 [Mythimna separata entomopoxvirus 'L']|uniref:Uncharacterized protein n=1 Tax=Mythimna separata entomopoxvirus 'L' TaxID=1293572 RepID=A0A916KQW6_9POXV|nr:hypothetical protein MYSEV_247 [Mythimna separata entomopoxvirus 'L']CCU56445.1 hypothetical protein MYSEV_247 [Mythimna separata entomopoxvirus 'L']